MWNTLFANPVDWQPALVALLLTLVIAWVAAHYARRLARSALDTFVGETLKPSSPLIRTPLRLVFIVTFVLVTGVLLFPALRLAGLRPRAGTTAQEISAWLLDPGLRIVL